MQKFERFIIYPLLIVALFYAVTGGAGTETLANPFASLIEDTIRTREVIIYNDYDEIIGVFGGIEGAGRLELLNGNGNRIVQLGAPVGKQNGLISVSNEDGELVASIAVSNKGHGGLEIFNDKGDNLIYLGPDNDGHGLINVYDKYGEDWRSYSFR